MSSCGLNHSGVKGVSPSLVPDHPLMETRKKGASDSLSQPLGRHAEGRVLGNFTCCVNVSPLPGCQYLSLIVEQKTLSPVEGIPGTCESNRKTPVASKPIVKLSGSSQVCPCPIGALRWASAGAFTPRNVADHVLPPACCLPEPSALSRTPLLLRFRNHVSPTAFSSALG